MTSSFAALLSTSDRTLLGTWVKMPTTVGVELLALAGFDFVVIDMEHAPLDLHIVHDLIGAAHGRHMQALVRVPDSGASVIARSLDSGADGVFVPHVDSVDDAVTVARAARFPPHGTRGFGPTVRAGSWGADVPGYLRSAENAFLVPQLESKSAVDAAPSIASVNGIDALFVGPVDLAVATGLEPTSADFSRLVTSVETAAKESGVPIGTAVAADPKAARSLRGRYDFVLVGNDASLLRGAGAALVEAVRSG